MPRYSAEIPNLLVMNKTLKVKTFNLPPGPPVMGGSCIACSWWCGKDGYCQHGHWNFPSVREALKLRLEATHELEFFQRMEYECSKEKLVRIHSAGEFYSLEYLHDWVLIVGDLKDTKFAAYTKTWRLALHHKIWAERLGELARLPNMTLWMSTDTSLVDPSQTDLAERLEVPFVRVAYIHGSHPKAGKTNCLKQLKPGESCRSCQLCWNPRRRRVTFRQH